MSTVIPIDDAKEIIQGALDDMRTSGKFRCQYNEIDSRVKCDGLGARSVPLNGKNLRVCDTCLKVILCLNPGLDSPDPKSVRVRKPWRRKDKMYFTIKDSDNKFHGRFGDRYAAEEYAMTRLKPQWQIICVNPSLILQGLIEALHWYVAEDYDDMLVKPSLKNTLDTLRETYGLVMTAEPDPLYCPADDLEDKTKYEVQQNPNGFRWAAVTCPITKDEAEIIYKDHSERCPHVDFRIVRIVEIRTTKIVPAERAKG